MPCLCVKFNFRFFIFSEFLDFLVTHSLWEFIIFCTWIRCVILICLLQPSLEEIWAADFMRLNFKPYTAIIFLRNELLVGSLWEWKSFCSVNRSLALYHYKAFLCVLIGVDWNSFRGIAKDRLMLLTRSIELFRKYRFFWRFLTECIDVGSCETEVEEDLSSILFSA